MSFITKFDIIKNVDTFDVKFNNERNNKMRKKLSIFIFILMFFNLSCIQTSFADNYKFSDLSGQKYETEHLIITLTTDEDLDNLSEYLLDSDVTKYIDPTIKDGFKTKEEALKFLKSKGSEEITKAIEFTIKLKDSNKPIGKLDLMLYEHSLVSLGYWLGKDYQGKGYMSEACFMLCNKAFNASDIKMLYVACDFENQRSAKLANKIFDYIKKENSTMSLSRSEREDEFRAILNNEEISFHCIQLILQKN